MYILGQPRKWRAMLAKGNGYGDYVCKCGRVGDSGGAAVSCTAAAAGRQGILVRPGKKIGKEKI